MWYWMNMETGKVLASEEPPYGADWIELSKEEYEMALHPLTPPQVCKMDIISTLIHEKIAKNTFNAAAIANGLHFDELPDDESRLARARLYRAYRDAGMKRQEAFDRANRESEYELVLIEEHEL